MVTDSRTRDITIRVRGQGSSGMQLLADHTKGKHVALWAKKAGARLLLRTASKRTVSFV